MGLASRRIRFRAVFVAVALASAALPGFAQTAPNVLILEEDYDPVWNVSGTLVAGVMAMSAAVEEPLLTLVGGEADSQVFCVDMVSRSRSFFTRLQIEVPAPATGPITVDLGRHVQRPEFIRQLASEHLAIKAVSSPCQAGSAGPQHYMIAHWGDGAVAEATAGLTVLLNARTTEAAVALRSNGETVAQRSCRRLEDPQQTGYDFVCDLPVEPSTVAAGTVEAIVVRRNFGSALPSDMFSIALGTGPQ